MSSQLPVEYHAIEQLLSAANALWDAAEAHGAFCGWACLGGAAAIPAWSAELLGSVDSADVLARDRQQELYKLAADALLQLEKGDMGFAPLLPSDEELLNARTMALAEWCQGFMHGLAVAGDGHTDKVAVRMKNALAAGATAEIMEDFSEITRADVGNDSEEISEQAYAELIEYVRVSAQLVYDEMSELRKLIKEKA